MTEEQIVQLISEDESMMDLLGLAGTLGLPHWLIGAGFVRTKVWDHLHARTGPSKPSDIDLVYFDEDEAFDDKQLEALLSQDIAFHADGGAKMNIVAKYLSGAHEVSGLLLYIYDKYQTGFSIIPTEINHEPSLLFYSGSTLVSCQVFDLSPEGKILRINTIIDPEKLKNIQLPVR